MEKWAENNRATEEDRFVDLFESLKKNEPIKTYVNKTLVEKLGERREVKTGLDVMSEKYSKTMCERIIGVMKIISRMKMNEKVDKSIDKFEEMMMEIEAVRLVDRLKYALSAQFVDRLEESGKINLNEKLRLKDILEDVNGNPKEGDNNTMELMKKRI